MLMRFENSTPCKQRMHDLHLDATLDRLLLQESGTVRDHVLKVLNVLRDPSGNIDMHVSSSSYSFDMHVCLLLLLMHKVLYVLRDREGMVQSARQIVAHVKALQSVSAFHSCNHKGHKDQRSGCILLLKLL